MDEAGARTSRSCSYSAADATAYYSTADATTYYSTADAAAWGDVADGAANGAAYCSTASVGAGVAGTGVDSVDGELIGDLGRLLAISNPCVVV